MRDIVSIEQFLKPQGRAHNLGPILVSNVHVNTRILVRRELAQQGAHPLGVSVKDGCAMRSQSSKQLPLRYTKVDRPARSTRQPAYRSMGAVGYRSISLVDIRDQDLGDCLAEFRLGGLPAIPVMRHHHNKRRYFSRCDQPVGSVVNAQAIPLIIGITLPVKKVKDRISMRLIELVAWRDIDPEVKRQPQKLGFQAAHLDLTALQKAVCWGWGGRTACGCPGGRRRCICVRSACSRCFRHAGECVRCRADRRRGHALHLVCTRGASRNGCTEDGLGGAYACAGGSHAGGQEETDQDHQAQQIARLGQIITSSDMRSVSIILKAQGKSASQVMALVQRSITRRDQLDYAGT